MDRLARGRGEQRVCVVLTSVLVWRCGTSCGQHGARFSRRPLPPQLLAPYPPLSLTWSWRAQLHHANPRALVGQVIASMASVPYLHAQLQLMTRQKRSVAELLGTLPLLERRRLNASHALDYELRGLALDGLRSGQCTPDRRVAARACNRSV